jgi:GAF domain-containing protein
MNENTVTETPKTEQSSNASPLMELRETILTWLMGLILILGSAMAYINSAQFIRAENYLFLFIAWGSIAYLVTIFVLGYFGKTSYRLRAVSSVALTYLIAVLAFDNFGLVGDFRSWLTLFVVLSSVMLGLRASIIANIVSFLTYISAGYLITNLILIPKESIGLDYSFSSEAWLTAGITLVFVNVILSVGVTTLLRGLNKTISDLQTSFKESDELSKELEIEHKKLEQRSLAYEKRAIQIRNAAEISRTMSAILDPAELMQKVVGLVQNSFDLYYVGIFTIDEHRRYANLSAGSGEPGKNMVGEGHRLAVGGSSMVGWATAHGQPRIALNVDQESVRFRNPHLPLTRSELALPISIGNETIGAMSVQSVEPEAFDDDDISMLQGISYSLGIALDNARLFQQFERSLGEIQQLNRRYLAESWTNIWAEDERVPDSEFGASQEEPAGDTQELSVPLVLRGDQVIGNISFDTEQTELSTDDKEFLDAITNQAALALESARLLDEANKRVEQERALRSLTTRFSQTLDFDTLLQTIVKEIGQLPLVRQASIHVVPPNEKEIIGSDPQYPSQPSHSPNDLGLNQ